jgi:phospholipase C
MLPRRLGRIWSQIVPLLVLVGVIAVACTTGSPATDTTADDTTPPPTSAQPAADEVPTWPNGALTPDPSVAPKGVDLQPLTNPPTHQPPPDDSAPIDPSKGIDNINHLVFIVMENRSFDEYFGTYPGADGIPMKNGKPTVCQPMPGGGCAYP